MLSKDRRSKRIAKDIDKGLRQLKGAIRQIRSGNAIYPTNRAIEGLVSHNHEPISLPDRDSMILSSILVSDLECELDWNEVASTMIDASDDNTFFQVLDLTELRNLVGAAENPLQFISNLVVRYANVQKEGTAFMRVRIRREQDK